jgi:hypothetical protein
VSLLVWVLVVWGVTSVINSGRILRSVREYWLPPSTFLGDFIRCPQCVGWWVGLSVSLFLHLGPGRAVSQLPGGVAVVVIADAFASSAVCAFLAKVEDVLKGIAVLMVKR